MFPNIREILIAAGAGAIGMVIGGWGAEQRGFERCQALNAQETSKVNKENDEKNRARELVENQRSRAAEQAREVLARTQMDEDACRPLTDDERAAFAVIGGN